MYSNTILKCTKSEKKVYIGTIILIKPTIHNLVIYESIDTYAFTDQ